MLNWYVYVSLIMLIVLLIIGLPIPLVMFGTTLFLVIFGGYSIDMLFPNAYTRLNSMTMVAFPLFIIAGGFIERGGIGEHLVNFVNLLLGRVKGGLAMMMSVCCGIFGAISGSSFAAETVIGELMIPRMNKAGYDNAVSSSLLASTCMLGSFIPPSGMMLVFCWLTNQPLLACFLATMIPGIVMMVAFCVWSYFKFKKDPNIIIEPAVAKGERLSHAAKVTWKSLPALFFPIFVLGAIYGGICTPSEAAAVSVFYAAFVGLFVYKKINFKDCVQIFVKTCCTAGVCGFMVFCVSMVSRIFMVENLNGAVEALLNAMGGNRYVILLCVNILLILFGMFLDDSSAMYICAPILTPVLANFGIDPVHFAAIMIVNLGLGCITPPCESVLFMGARVGKSSLTKMLPSTYSLILFVWLPMLAILTLFPNVALWLPRVMLGYGA